MWIGCLIWVMIPDPNLYRLPGIQREEMEFPRPPGIGHNQVDATPGGPEVDCSNSGEGARAPAACPITALRAMSSL